MFSVLAQNVPRPEVAAALEVLLWPQHSYTDDSLHEFFPNYGTAFKRNFNVAVTDDNVFLLYLNVNQFRPKDITVKLVEDSIIIQGKHDMKLDEHGYVGREFTRRFKVPDDVEKKSLKSIFTKNGLLTIKGSKIVVKSDSEGEQTIPVHVQQPVEAALVTDEESVVDDVDANMVKTPTGTEYHVAENQ